MTGQADAQPAVRVEGLRRSSVRRITRVSATRACAGPTSFGNIFLRAASASPCIAPQRYAIERPIIGYDPYPPRKDRPVLFGLPPITSAADAVQASGALVAAVAEGELTPSEAGELGKLVEAYVKALEATEFDERLGKLERMTNR
jgi:hypothetical protein